MPQDPSELKSMSPYRDVDRIYNELLAAGLDNQKNSPLQTSCPSTSITITEPMLSMSP